MASTDLRSKPENQIEENHFTVYHDDVCDFSLGECKKNYAKY